MLSGSFGYLCYAVQAQLWLCPLITIANKENMLQTHPQGDLMDTTLLRGLLLLSFQCATLTTEVNYDTDTVRIETTQK